MKKSNKKDIWIFILLIPVFLWLSLNFSGDKNNDLIPFSVLNKGSKGVSVMYEAMKQLNYPVKLAIDEVNNKNFDIVQIVIIPEYNSNFDINDEDIKNWVRQGGKLVYLCVDWEDIDLRYGKEIDSFSSSDKNGASVFFYEKGIVLIGDSELITNKTLTKDTDGAYWILEQIDKLAYQNVEFNEFYHYSNRQSPSLWSDIPKGIKFMLYQLAFSIAAIIFYKGKRFGKPVPLYEEVERTENEYIFSVASLYQQAGCWEVVLESYYEDFLQEAEKVFGKNEHIRQSWIELWEKEKLQKLNKAKELYKFIDNEMNDNKSQKSKSKKYLQIISLIQQLKKILIKRRENHWERLKKDIQKV